MEEYKSTYPSDEKLTASTHMDIENRSDSMVTIENWTCGFGFRVDSVNLAPHSSGRVNAEYVWYDFLAKDQHNKELATITGVYFNRKVIFTQSTDGSFHLSSEKR